MKNLLNNQNKDISYNNNEISGETIKKNLNDEFSKNKIDNDSSNKMLIEEELNKKSNVLDTVKKNLDTNEFGKKPMTLDYFFKSNKKTSESKLKQNTDNDSNKKDAKYLKDNTKKMITGNNNINNNFNSFINEDVKKNPIDIIDGVTEEDLDLFLNEALNECKAPEISKEINFPLQNKNENLDDIDWNDIDFSDLVKEQDKETDICNNFGINKPINPLSSINILSNNNNKNKNNLNIANDKNSKREINITNNINIVNNFNINQNNSINFVPNLNVKNNLTNDINIKNEEKNSKIVKSDFEKDNNNNTENANTNQDKAKIKEVKQEKDIDEIDTENLFNQLRKLKEKSNLDALFEKYQIDISIKKQETKEDSKLECPICFEKQGK